ncbi:MAG TPA: hypothetical protein VKH46_01950 [Thermoanaerobaculia bacterium]|jgi:ElaB/YqjD/DUF883 family membrane-anchored ribosome-binding protein|nr:hypothetical protein [Thermoanaerobaculia bacterium]
MEDLNKSAGENVPSPGPIDAGVRRAGGDGEIEGSSIWEELRARRAKASRRIGEGWERASESAKDYTDEHSVGVALGSLGVGIALGVLMGVLIGRD